MKTIFTLQWNTAGYGELKDFAEVVFSTTGSPTKNSGRSHMEIIAQLLVAMLVCGPQCTYYCQGKGQAAVEWQAVFSKTYPYKEFVTHKSSSPNWYFSFTCLLISRAFHFHNPSTPPPPRLPALQLWKPETFRGVGGGCSQNRIHVLHKLCIRDSAWTNSELFYNALFC